MAEVSFAEVKEKVLGIGTAFEEFKANEAKRAKDGDVLLTEKFNKITEEITTKYGEVKEGLAKLEGKFNRPGLGEADQALVKAHTQMQFIGRCTKGSQSPLANISYDDYLEYSAAYSKYLRAGMESELPTEVRKAMSVGSDPDGGYWITPPEIDGQIRSRIFETSPMRKVATVQPISTHEYKVNEDPNELTAGWVGETAPRPVTTTPKIATKVITAHEIYAQPSVTRIFLEDAAINVESWLTGKVADKFNRVQNTAFLFGNGVAQPRGLLTYAAGSLAGGANKWGEIEQIVSGASNTFAYDSLITLITSIKDPYQDGAEFLVRRQSLAPIMTLKDGAGRYIFQPILNGSFNNTPLFGYPVNYASDMQPTGTSGAIVMAFGNFKRGYMIVDRVGTSMIRDELTQKPFVLFYTRQRVGGDVVDFDAIKLYVTS